MDAANSRQTLEALETIFATLHVLMAHLDREFNFIRVNAAYAAADGHPPEYYPGKNHFDLFPNPENEAVFKKVVDTGQPHIATAKPFVFAARPERGTSYWDWELHPVMNPAGEVTSLLLVIIDVTQKIKAIQEREAAIAYSRVLFEALPDPVTTVSREGILKDANGAAERVYGYRRDEFIGRDFRDFLPDVETANAGFDRLLQKGHLLDYRLAVRHKDGHHVTVLLNAALYTDPQTGEERVIATARDISEQLAIQREREQLTRELKASNEALRRRTILMERAEHLARIGYWEADIAEGREHWSDELYRLVGLEPHAFSPRLLEFIRFVHPDDRERIAAVTRENIEQGASFDEEFRVIWPNGEEHALHSFGSVEADPTGRPAWVFGVAQDITAFKRMEWLLRERFRVIAENLRDVVWISTPNNQQIVYLNPAFERVWGFSRETMYRNPGRFFDTLHPDDRGKIIACTAQQGSGEWNQQYRIVRPDGAVRWIQDRGFPVVDEKGDWNVIVGIASDVTEQKTTEEALRRKSRELERINAELEEFAYAASHDLKAPLRAVANLAHWIEEDAAEGLDAENRERLHLMRNRIFRMDRLIDGLLAYARLGRRAENPQPVALAPLLKDLLREITLPETFEVTVPGELPKLAADPMHLRQIFQNLIINSVQHHDRERGRIRIAVSEQGDAWRIEVADDGPGIPASARESVFKMFTRLGSDGGEHTGIGLALVRKLVLSYGGQIRIRENEPRGTVVEILWPR